MKILSYAVILLFIGVLMAFPAMLLWNSCLVPAVTSLKEVDFLQMMGINILVTIMFKGVEVNSK